MQIVFFFLLKKYTRFFFARSLAKVSCCTPFGLFGTGQPRLTGNSSKQPPNPTTQQAREEQQSIYHNVVACCWYEKLKPRPQNIGR